MEDKRSNICSIMSEGILALLWGLMRSNLPFSWSLLLGCLILVSCNKDKRQELFQLNHHVEFDIVPGLNTLDTHIYSIAPIKSLLEDHLAASGKTLSDVVAIEAYQANLSSIFQDVNLDFIDKISVLIFDPFDHTKKIEFFYLDPVPFKNKVNIELFPGIADVSEWMEKEYFGIEIRLNYRQVTPSLIQMRFEFDLRVLGE